MGPSDSFHIESEQASRIKSSQAHQTVSNQTHWLTRNGFLSCGFSEHKNCRHIIAILQQRLKTAGTH